MFKMTKFFLFVTIVGGLGALGGWIAHDVYSDERTVISVPALEEMANSVVGDNPVASVSENPTDGM